MSDTLREICEKKKEHVAARKAAVSLENIKKRAHDAAPALSFSGALRAKKPALIAEVKKASPSKGVIRADFNPIEIAKIYAANGAACISVLTDAPYFQGHDDYLAAIRKEVSLPLLRKDFMIDPYQIYESRALGADCILIIMAALTDAQAKEFFDLAAELGMDSLIEVHDQEELERAKALNPVLLGVNNRNLKTLKVDIETARLLEPLIPDTALKIAESGIEDHTALSVLSKAGYDAFLVGESLMRQDDIGGAVRALLGNS